MEQEEQFRKSLKEALHSCISPSIIAKDRSLRTKEFSGFDTRKFFASWYRQPKQAHFFLFRKNLKVTNIQFAELLALVRVHSSRVDGKKPYPAEQASSGGLQFVSQIDFNLFLEQL